MIKLVIFITLMTLWSITFASSSLEKSPSKQVEFHLPSFKQTSVRKECNNFETAEFVFHLLIEANSLNALRKKFDLKGITEINQVKCRLGINHIEKLIEKKLLPSKAAWPLSAIHIKCALKGKNHPNQCPKKSDKKKVKYEYLARSKHAEWSKSVKESQGIKFNFVDDRDDDSKIFSSKGAVIFKRLKAKKRKKNGDPFINWVKTPFIEWDVESSSAEEDDDKESLKLGMGFSVEKLLPATTPSSIRYSFVPFYATDFGLDGEILGFDLDVKPNLWIFSDNYKCLKISKSSCENKPYYLLEIQPKVSFKKVNETSKYIDREKGDEDILIGGTLRFGLKPLGKKTPWELLGTYSYFDDLVDSNVSIKKTTFTAKYHINENVSVTYEAQDGEDFLTRKNNDKRTLGFEVKY